MKKVNEVYSTVDYSLFKPLKGNRNPNKLHIKRLRESFQNRYLLSPIIVNEKYEIIDGQHRAAAAKELGLPIYFIIAQDYGLPEIQLLNTNMKNWNKLDYLNAYCDLKYPEYLRFRNYMNRFPEFNLATCEVILSGKLGSVNRRLKELRTETNPSGVYTVRDFTSGDFTIPDYALSVEYGNRLLSIKPFYDGFTRQSFVLAIVGIFRSENYNHATFISRLNSCPIPLEHRVNVEKYKLLIEEIYNFRSRNKVSLKY